MLVCHLRPNLTDFILFLLGSLLVASLENKKTVWVYFRWGKKDDATPKTEYPVQNEMFTGGRAWQAMRWQKPVKLGNRKRNLQNNGCGRSLCRSFVAGALFSTFSH